MVIDQKKLNIFKDKYNSFIKVWAEIDNPVQASYNLMDEGLRSIKNKKNKVKIILLSGPKAVGKDYFIDNGLIKIDAYRVVFETTRIKRRGEIDGQDYNFLTKEEFVKNKGNHLYSRWNDSGKFWRGLSRSNIDEVITDKKLAVIRGGKDTLKTLSPLLKKDYGKESVLSVFLIPPTFDVWIERLINRNRTNNKNWLEIESQIKESLDLMKNMSNNSLLTDLVIVNDTQEGILKAVNKISNIIL